MNRALYRGAKKLQKVFSLKANRAETGIGTLIVFIAMVLVAAVAATVLIHTAGNLQQTAQSTGQQTTAQVSSGLAIQQIIGFDSNTTNPESGTLNYTLIYLSVNTGGSAVDLGNSTVSLYYEGHAASLTYHDNFTLATQTGSSNLVSLTSKTTWGGALKGSEFGVAVIHNPSSSLTQAHPVLTYGSEVVLVINNNAVFGTGGVAQGETVTGQVTPQVGSPAVIDFTTPVAFTSAVVQLQ